MKPNTEDFNALVGRVMASGSLAQMRPVVEKELLHYDILYCLDQANLLDELVFQGGTALRLCYGANRYSEDLDFLGGPAFAAEQLSAMKTVLEDYLGSRYALEVHVKEPKRLHEGRQVKETHKEKTVDTWQLSVITAPAQRDVPQQRIKIEVARISAYTKQPLALQRNYDALPDFYQNTFIYTETLDEIMADKLIALPASEKHIRYRDIWDLAWLYQQGARVEHAMVKHKIKDYALDHVYRECLQKRVLSLPDLINGQRFLSEMRRFIPMDIFERTLAQAKFTMYLEQIVTSLLQSVQKSLDTDEANPTLEPPFRL